LEEIYIHEEVDSGGLVFHIITWRTPDDVNVDSIVVERREIPNPQELDRYVGWRVFINMNGEDELRITRCRVKCIGKVEIDEYVSITVMQDKTDVIPKSLFKTLTLRQMVDGGVKRAIESIMEVLRSSLSNAMFWHHPH